MRCERTVLATAVPQILVSSFVTHWLLRLAWGADLQFAREAKSPRQANGLPNRTAAFQPAREAICSRKAKEPIGPGLSVDYDQVCYPKVFHGANSRKISEDHPVETR